MSETKRPTSLDAPLASRRCGYSDTCEHPPTRYDEDRWGWLCTAHYDRVFLLPPEPPGNWISELPFLGPTAAELHDFEMRQIRRHRRRD